MPRSTMALLAVLVALGLLLPDFELLALNQHLFLAINVMALNFCLGLGGQASLAQGAFCGLGAYASVILHQALPDAPWTSMVIVPGVTASVFLLAAGLSYPLERLAEGFLAMATLGLSLIFVNLVLGMESLTNGPAGLMVDAPLRLPGVAISGDKTYTFLFLATLTLGVVVFERLKPTRLGRALLACRHDPTAAAACGINRPLTRALSFGLGGALSALAGILHAHYAGFISPRQYDLELSLKTLLFLVIGGSGGSFGPILAVLALETALSRMHFLGDAKVLAHGLLLSGALLFAIHSDKGAPTGVATGAKGGRGQASGQHDSQDSGQSARTNGDAGSSAP